MEFHEFKDIKLGVGNFKYDTTMNVLFSLKANKELCTKENCMEMLQELYQHMQKQIIAVYDDKPFSATISSES